MLNFTHHKDQFNILDPSSFHRLTKPTTKCNVNPIHPPLTDASTSITNHSPSTTQPNKPQTPTINPNSPKLSLRKHHNQNPTPMRKTASRTNSTTNNHQTSETPNNHRLTINNNQLLTYSRPPWSQESKTNTPQPLTTNQQQTRINHPTTNQNNQTQMNH